MKTKGYQTTSRTKTVMRFHTAEVTALIGELEYASQVLSDSFYPAIQNILLPLYDNKECLDRVLADVGTFDALVAFAEFLVKTAATNPYEHEMYSPVEFSNEADQVLHIERLHHPMLSHLMIRRGQHFVLNDVTVSQENRVHVVTGSNMAGKSTILKAIALAVLMAQVFGWAPASKAKLRFPFDNIYTRFGAYDAILQGKSTFMIELEEVAPCLSYMDNTDRQPRILAIMDELGRGTSTFDGSAIALAFLKNLSSRDNGSVCYFSTHYHVIAAEVENNLIPNCTNEYMQSDVSSDGSLKFSYKLVKGMAEESQGILIAKQAGLPEKLLAKAVEQATRMKQRMDKLTISTIG